MRQIVPHRDSALPDIRDSGAYYSAVLQQTSYNLNSFWSQTAVLVAKDVPSISSEARKGILHPLSAQHICNLAEEAVPVISHSAWVYTLAKKGPP